MYKIVPLKSCQAARSLLFSKQLPLEDWEKYKQSATHLWKSGMTSETHSYNEEEKWIIWGGGKLSLLIEFIEKADRLSRPFLNVTIKTKTKKPRLYKRNDFLGCYDIERNSLRVWFQMDISYQIRFLSGFWFFFYTWTKGFQQQVAVQDKPWGTTFTLLCTKISNCSVSTDCGQFGFSY